MRAASPCLALSCLSILLGACGAEAPDGPEERIGMMRGAIVGGELDTKHQAVVALFGSKSACTATIVAVKGNQGFALTAAHCVADAPKLVVQGNDYESQSAIVYKVVKYEAHPSYNKSVYDFAMVQFSGAGASTPVIPAMAKAQDALKSGSVIDFVGYGLTENGQTSQRHHVLGKINSTTGLTYDYTQENGGPCSGDSGGPALSNVNGVEVVSGVTSYGDEKCQQYGVSGRVSAVYDSFILPFINGGGGGAQTCDECIESATTGVGGCTGEVDACVNDDDCEALLECFNGCQSDACYQSCAQKHPSGVQIYLDIIDCLCTESCVAECKDAPMCEEPDQPEEPKCGFTAEPVCQGCFEKNCCPQASACAADPVCQTCFGPSPDPGCPNSALAKGFADCVATACPGPCNIDTGGEGGGSGTGGSGTGTGTETGTATGAGAGAPTGDDGGEEAEGGGDTGGKKKNRSSDEAVDEEGGCALVSGAARPGLGATEIGLLVLGAAGLRRRRRGCSR